MTSRYALRAAVAVSCLSFSAAALAGPIGKVVSLSGDGQIIRGEKELSIELMSPVHAQDVIETEAEGIAVIQFDDQSSLTVGAKSRITIDEYVYDPKDPLLGTSSINVGKGFFQFVSGSMRKDKVSINTPVSTMGIRGTELFGEVKDDGVTWVSLVECCVELRSEAGKIDLIREGTYSEVVSEKKKPTQPELSPAFWVNKASAALGIPKDKLGMPELEEDDNGSGVPFNRKSFPFVD